VSHTNDGPPEGAPSRGSQKGLMPVVTSSLQPRQPRGGLRPRAESQQGITPQFVLSAMRQWWKVVVPVGLLLGAVSGTVVYALFEPVYEASAWLEIKDRAPYIAFPDRDSSRSFISTQQALICSPLVLCQVTSRPEIARLPELAEEEDQIGFLAKKIQVKQEGNSEIFRISYAASDPQSTKEVVFAVVEEYFKLRGGTDAERTQRMIQLLGAERDRRAQEVDRLRENVREMTKQATGGIDPFAMKPAPGTAVANPLADLQARLTTAEVERETLGAQIKAFEELALGLSTKGTTSGDGSGAIRLEGRDNAIAVKASKPGPTFGNVAIVLAANKVKGDQATATVSLDGAARTLTIDVDPAATTANAVIKAINSEGTFTAERDTTSDSTNDGTGLVCKVEVSEAMVDKVVEENAEVQARRAQLSSKLAKLEEFRSKLVRGEQDPAYQRLEEEITRDRGMLDELRGRLRQEGSAGLATSLANKWKEDLAGMRAQFQSYRLLEEMLRKKCDEQRKDMQQASGETLELEFARQDLARVEDVFSRIAQRVVELRTEQGAPARVELLQRDAQGRPDVRLPLVPVQKYPWKQIILAVLASLALPFGLVVLWERIVRRVTDAEQLEQQSSLGVIGEVARLPVRTNVLSESSSKLVGRGLGLFEESIDTLRTCLILSEPLKDMKVLAVTSGSSREGKTSVAVQLAVSIARASGQPTLLIDGDMRSPDVHTLLETPLEPGLGDVLAHKCELGEAVVRGWGEHLDFLPAGKVHTSPHKLLGNGAVGQLLEGIRDAYRYVIIDTPPVLAAGEALILASAADATLICTMRDRSRLDQVRRTQERLLAAGARPVGIVLNGVPIRRYLYRYGSYAYGHE
jgi:succinoglycan biosynthesis transport protein ExoP